MRLTLRTLLAYLDDTLEPAQAKNIGQKVAESEQARELIDRIKQVSRMRRLTTPPTSGPGSRIDPNTIAEYLDSTVTPEQAGEVEQIALASDVHLAEIASCHQILTLALVQPALVPSPAMQRMYGLVKGPEAIPFRKPTKEPARSEEELLGEAREVDEALRLGLPLIGKGKWSGIVLFIGVGTVAVGLLLFSLYQMLAPPADIATGPGPIAQIDPNKKDDATGKQNGTELPIPKKDKDLPLPPPPIPKFDDPTKVIPKKVDPTPKVGKVPGTVEPGTPKKQNPVEPPALPPPFPGGKPTLPEVGYQAPDNRSMDLGKVLPSMGPQPSRVLTRPVDGESWFVMPEKKDAIFSGNAYMCFPGWNSVMLTRTGVAISLRGSLPEILPSPPVLESMIELHQGGDFDVDMTLRRGRVVLRNMLEQGAATVRLRFANPTQPGQKDFIDLALQGKGASVLIDRWAFLPPGEPFYKDPKHANRVGPAANMGFLVLKGDVLARMGSLSYGLSAPPGQALLLWDSLKGLNRPQQLKTLPPITAVEPPIPDGIDAKVRSELEKIRKQINKARASIDADLATKAVDVALAESLSSMDPGRRVLAVRCFAAIDDLPALADALTQKDQPEVRQTAIRSLQHWITTERDNEYKLYDFFNMRLGSAEAEKTLELFHGIPKVDRIHLDILVDYLNSSSLVLRELAYMNLFNLVPQGRSIPFDATAAPAQRQAAQNAWRDAIRKALAAVQKKS